jgi:hypothetical protein
LLAELETPRAAASEGQQIAELERIENTCR